jgi:gliding motility-associated-like protein
MFFFPGKGKSTTIDSLESLYNNACQSKYSRKCTDLIRVANYSLSAPPTWGTMPGDLDRIIDCSDLEGLLNAQALTPVAIDNCDEDETIVSKFSGPFIPGSCGGTGTYTNVWTATDDCGSLTYTQIITITDLIAPTWVTPLNSLNRTVSCEDAAALTAAQNLFPVATDNCDGDVTNIVKSSGSFAPGSCGQSGTYTNTWTVTDDCGNASATYTQIITVTDLIAPTFIVPSDITICRNIDCSFDISTSITGDVIDENDNCSTGLDAIFVDESHLTSCNEFGYIKRIWTLTDACGNTTTKEQLIWIEPSPKVFSSIEGTETICNNNKTNIILTTNSIAKYGIEFTYTSTASIPGIGNGSGSITPNNKIDELLSNLTDVPQTVTYEIIPWILDAFGNKKCSGTSIDIVVTVEPTPKVTIITTTPIVCQGGNLNISIGSPTTSTTLADLSYEVVVTSSDDANLGGTASVDFSIGKGDLPYAITGTLTNSSDKPIIVTYTVTPKLGSCSSGTPKSISISVEPTPQVNISKLTTTICNNSGPLITLSSQSSFTTGLISFNYTVEATGGASGFVSPTDNLPNNYVIADQLTNPTDDPQTVKYKIVPVSPVGCADGPEKTLIVTVLPQIKYDFKDKQYIGGKNIRCKGESNGTLKVVNAKGGLATGYTYKWSTGEETDSIRNKTAGAYSVVVTDQLGCNTTQSFTLQEPNAIHFKVEELKNIKCKGATGSIDISVLGGNPSFKYLWTTNSEPTKWYTQDISGLNEARYYLTVEDTNKCKKDTIVTVLDKSAFPYNLRPSRYSDYNISCNGKSDGKFTPYLETTNPILGYHWTGPKGFSSNSLNITNLLPGDYTLTVDFTECSHTFDPVTLTEPPAGVITGNKSIYGGGFNVECNEGTNGKIDVSVQGGHASYKYVWTSANGTGIVQGAQDQNALSTGDYIIEVKDKYFFDSNEYYCSYKDTFTLTEPPALMLDTTFSDYNGYQIDCNRNKSGNIDVSLTGGFGTYTYNWTTTNGSGLTPGNEDQTGLGAGTYHLKVIYGGVCPKDYSFILKEPSLVVLDSIVSDFNGYNVSCYGSSNGAIQLNPKGAIMPYTYNWSTTDGSIVSPTLKDQANLKAGTYHLQMTDKNNCNYAWDIKVRQPELLSITADVLDIKCSGSGSGSIEAKVTGGTPEYAYKWSNGATTKIITNVTVNDYSVTVTDKNLCQKEVNAHVSAPEPLDIKIDKKDISCFGKNDGAISLYIQGGRSPYKYVWSTGDDKSKLDNLTSSTYSVDVTDSVGCKGTATAEIIEPDSLKVDYSKQDLSCFNRPSGRIELLPSGGTAPYYYIWSNGYRSRVIENLKAGEYLAIVRDKNNCPSDLVVTLTQPEAIEMTKEVTLPYCPDTQDGAIKIVASGGTGILNYSWNTGGNSNELTSITEGFYVLSITDGNNCLLRDTTLLESVSSGCVDIPTAISPNGDGVNDSWDIRAGNPTSATKKVQDLYPEAIMQIYNRWGILIFKSSPGYTEDWDGTWNGRTLPIDSYFYIFDLKNGKKPLSGNVTIIR